MKKVLVFLLLFNVIGLVALSKKSVKKELKDFGFVTGLFCVSGSLEQFFRSDLKKKIVC